MDLREHRKLSFLFFALVIFAQITKASIRQGSYNPSIWDIILLPYSHLDYQRQEGISDWNIDIDPFTWSLAGNQTKLKSHFFEKSSVVKRVKVKCLQLWGVNGIKHVNFVKAIAKHGQKRHLFGPEWK